METWAAKDPDAVLDYTYTIPLDEGDGVASYTLTRVSGTVVIDSDSEAAGVVTAWLSGGAAGETSLFLIAWITDDGREDDDYITLLVSDDAAPVALTDYAKPAPSDLIARYPAFADVNTTTIQYWLTDAERFVDDSWIEGDYAAGLMAMAAHNMVLAGLGTEAAATSELPAGVTSFKSGALSVAFSEGAANDRATGALSSTRYGAEFAMLRRRNKGGPRVTPTGTVPYVSQRYVDGEDVA
jgi:hypothetical protein